MRILGVDPGSRRTGVGVIEERGGCTRCLGYTTIQTLEDNFNERLRSIFEQLQSIVRQHQPDRIAIEKVFVSKNAEASLKLGHARGAAICALVQAGAPIAEYSPNAIKKALVGRGHADKNQVMHMVRVLLALADALPPDAADALAVALCDQHHAQTAARLEARQ